MCLDAADDENAYECPQDYDSFCAYANLTIGNCLNVFKQLYHTFIIVSGINVIQKMSIWSSVLQQITTAVHIKNIKLKTIILEVKYCR